MNKKDGLENKVANIIVHVCDQGQHGSTYCENCNYELSKEPRRQYDECPGCGYKLRGVQLGPSFGGSDF